MTPRRAFTLVEVLVALLLLAVAVAALTATISADRHVRTTAVARAEAANQLRERLEMLAARCGTADTGGINVGAFGVERWRGSAATDVWSLADSVYGSPGTLTVALEAQVPCHR